MNFFERKGCFCSMVACLKDYIRSYSLNSSWYWVKIGGTIMEYRTTSALTRHIILDLDKSMITLSEEEELEAHHSIKSGKLRVWSGHN